MIDLAVGAMLGGKYRIDKLLGKGGMGAVYLAENTDIGRKVAIKILHADFAQDQGILQRFRMEARAAAAIGHPGIVDVLDLGTTAEGAEFIVMERLEGETLGGRISRRGALPPDEVIPIVCDVLDALAAAHDRGVVHRDLKPENLFLVERPVKIAKILDFGISKFSGTDDVSLTRTGTVMGSPLYMSPEQARGAKDIGLSTDLYSIGAILYEALAGVPPFAGTTYNEVIASVLMDKPVSLIERKPELPPALSAVVDSLLAKTPAERPPDARAVRAELRRAHAPGATDVEIPTVPAQTQQRAAPSGERASIAPDAATRPAETPPTEVIRRQRRTVMVVVGLGLAVVLVVAGYAVRRKAELATPPEPLVKPPVVAIAPPPTPPPAPAKISLTLLAEPAAATWKLDGEPLSCNPCTVTHDAGSSHVATASAPGFADGRLELIFDRTRDEKLALVALPKERHPHPPPHPGDQPKPPKPPKPDDPSITIDKSNPFK